MIISTPCIARNLARRRFPHPFPLPEGEGVVIQCKRKNALRIGKNIPHIAALIVVALHPFHNAVRSTFDPSCKTIGGLVERLCRSHASLCKANIEGFLLD